MNKLRRQIHRLDNTVNPQAHVANLLKKQKTSTGFDFCLSGQLRWNNSRSDTRFLETVGTGLFTGRCPFRPATKSTKN